MTESDLVSLERRGLGVGSTSLASPVKPHTVPLGYALQVPVKEETESLQVDALHGQLCPRRGERWIRKGQAGV